MFKYYDENTNLDWLGWEHVVLVDPARRVGDQNAHTAIAGVSINALEGKVRLRELRVRSMNPDEQVRETFEVMDQIGALTLGLETTGGDEYILWPFKNYSSQTGRYCEIIELKSPGGIKNLDSKMRRVMSLYPMYAKGQIEHNSNGCALVLENQLLSLPKPKRIDAADVFSRVVAMMEEGQRYFKSGPVAQADFEKAYAAIVARERAADLESGWTYRRAI
jgi:hypothetical protein